jgi:uncharacterized membrane protein
MLSIVSIVATPGLIARTLRLQLSKVVLASLALAILGWASSIEDLRDGQSGPYLMLLTLLGWSFLRTGRPWLAGTVVGVATCLKLYPGILLIYFLLKDRRAFVSGALTVVAGLLLSWLLCGPRVFIEYIQTARFVSNYYSGYSSNISLLGCLLRIAGGTEREVLAKLVWSAFATTYVIGAILSMLPWRSEQPERGPSIDLEYSIFLSLSVLLTPIAWDHYTILLVLPLAILAERVLRQDADRRSTVGFFVLVVCLATPFGTFAFARSSLDSHIDDYFLKATLLNVRTVSIIGLIGWLMWRSAVGRGSFPRLASARSNPMTPEIKSS